MSHLIIAAASFATEAHKGQKRKYNGLPYIWHPMRVAGRLMIEGASSAEVATGWLHDVVEDCGVTPDEIEKRFGSVVRNSVSALTNRSKIDHPNSNRAERKKIDQARLATAPSYIKRIKVIDRIDNLHEMLCAPNDFLQLYLAESRSLLDAIAGPWPLLENELLSLIVDMETL